MNQRIMLTKKLLKNSLTEMLKKQNIYQISIRELCENAGINRSTFYKYYGSQFDLLSEMEQDLFLDIERMLEEQNDYSRNGIEQILTYVEANIEFIRLLINSNVDPEFPKKLFSLSPIQNMINELVDDLPENEFDYFNRFLLFGAYEIIRTWINKENRESVKWLAALLYKFIVHNNKAK